MSAMFANAVAAIRMGIEDYALDRPERSLSAVRKFYAGVLLLAKEVLVRQAPLADPDAVIGTRYKPIPDGLGGITYVPDSHTTIDFTTLGKRFKAAVHPHEHLAIASTRNRHFDNRNTVRRPIASDPRGAHQSSPTVCMVSAITGRVRRSDRRCRAARAVLAAAHRGSRLAAR